MLNQIKEPATIETAVVGVVDTVKGSFLELVAFAKSVGPDVWEIMVRQQFAEATSISIGLVIMLMVTPLSYIIIAKRPGWALNKNENVIGWVSSVVSTVGSAILIVVFLAHALPRFLNPAYYALMELAKLKP